MPQDRPAGIHSDHPFVPPAELREPTRRLRGRLAAPVTVWTAGGPDSREGLTVSSLMVAEGEPASVFGLIGETADLWERIEQTGRFIVHVLEEGHEEVADRFAGVRPSPGGPFRGLDVEDSEWGPVLTAFGTRAYCRLEEASESGFHLLVRGFVERIDMHDLQRPLLYFRGRYHGIPKA